MQDTIREIYQKGTVVGQSGTVHALHSAMDPQEGEFLFNLIRDDASITKTLEVGCAFGLSSLHICMATHGRDGALHTIIDPFQMTEWDGAGIRNLESAGMTSFHLMQLKSEFALPQLLQNHEGTFDFIFIDGWHTFDHTLLDCFFASRLLRVGGILAIDDVDFPAVKGVVSFLKSYPCYEEHGSVAQNKPPSWKRTLARWVASPVDLKTWAKILEPTLYQKIFEERLTRLIALKKVGPDERPWYWHSGAF